MQTSVFYRKDVSLEQSSDVPVGKVSLAQTVHDDALQNGNSNSIDNRSGRVPETFLRAGQTRDTLSADDSNIEGNASGMNKDLQPEEAVRAHVYGLLSRLLAAPMSGDTMQLIRGLVSGDDGAINAADTSEIADSIDDALYALSHIAKRTTESQAEEEFTILFYGHGAGGSLQPYSSFYQTGFIYEKPLAELRKDLARLGIGASGETEEPEDHIAFLCEIMHGLITGRFGDVATLDEQAAFFSRHIKPWANLFFTDLETAEGTVLYMPLGTLGRIFMSIEDQAFNMIDR